MILLATIQCSIHVLFYFIVVWVTLDPWDLRLKTISKGSLGHDTRPNFKHLSQVALKKKISEYFSMHFYGSNLQPPGPGPSWTLRPSFEQTK